MAATSPIKTRFAVFGRNLCAASSVRFGRFIIHSRLIRNPVHLPGLASVVGECLLKVGRFRVGVRPDKSNIDGSPFPWLLIKELAASIPELADHGLSKDAILAVGPIDTPLVGLGIVQPEGQTLDVTL